MNVSGALRGAGRRRVAAGLTGAFVILAGAGAAVMLAAGGESTVDVASGGLVSNQTAGVSATLPEGWQELPRVDRPLPPEVMVVGTAARPGGEPIEACGASNAVPATRSGYLTIYEYAPHGPFPSPTGDAEYPFPMFQPPPPDFGAGYDWGAECDAAGNPLPVSAPVPPVSAPQVTDLTQVTAPTVTDPEGTTTLPPTTLPPTTLPPAANFLREVAFTDAGRAFAARIVTVQDPSGELLAQAYAILNSLQIDTPSVTTTTLYHGPDDQDAARQEIIDAIDAAFGTPSPVPFADSVEGGHPLATEEQKQAAAEIAKNADPITRGAYEASQAGAIVVQINWIDWDSPTHATLNFDLLAHGAPITATTTGDAVFEHGHWRMGRATWCEIAGRGGVRCPG